MVIVVLSSDRIENNHYPNDYGTSKNIQITGTSFATKQNSVHVCGKTV
jgi:hypothetical protein